MAALTNIQVDEVILHILDLPDTPAKPGEPPKPARRGLVLSQRSLPPQTDARVFGYFRDHIADSLKSDHVRVAQFAGLAAPVAAACKAILAPGGDLVQGSQTLARGLYALMTKNASIARGDLALCRYSAQEGGQSVSQLAVLKIDPSEAFSQTTRTDEQGKRYVAVEVEAEVLPTGELQKCALVRRLEPRPADYDMILLDRQLAGEDVARFFSYDFLGADLVTDSRQATKKLNKILTDAENLLRSTLQPDEIVTSFQQQARNLLASPSVTRKQLVQIVPAAVEKEVSESVQAARLPDRIDLDRAYLAKTTKTITYEGDDGLTLTVPANRFAELVTVIPPKKTGPGTKLYEVVIRTKTWEKVR